MIIRKIRPLLLQCKFLLVEWLNISYNFIPIPLRNVYFKLYGIRISKKSYIHRACKLFHVGNLTIGKNSVVNFGCYLDNRRGIYIGDNVGIAHNSKLYTLGHDLNDPEFKTIGKPIHIHDNAFIFSNALIMPGVTIGNGAIVLAGSVVTKDVEPWAIVGGNPAVKIKERKRDIQYLNDYSYWFAL